VQRVRVYFRRGYTGVSRDSHLLLLRKRDENAARIFAPSNRQSCEQPDPGYPCTDLISDCDWTQNCPTRVLDLVGCYVRFGTVYRSCYLRFGTVYRSSLKSQTILESTFFLDHLTLQVGPIGCPEASVKTYEHTPRNNPKKWQAYPAPRQGSDVWHCSINVRGGTRISTPQCMYMYTILFLSRYTPSNLLHLDGLDSRKLQLLCVPIPQPCL